MARFDVPKPPVGARFFGSTLNRAREPAQPAASHSGGAPDLETQWLTI